MQFVRRPAQRAQPGDGLDVLQLLDAHAAGPSSRGSPPRLGERETLSLLRGCLLDPRGPAALLWIPRTRPEQPGTRHGTRKERDVRRLTRRRHIDLGRVSSAFCCRGV
ncbi:MULTISPECIES: putative leader peptide [unclassified Streptomyces]|uniref:putative leader peptide n=1 Tax=unclassified Streptomyces TaxID=2593676 RepID=UPI0037A15DBD